MANSVEKQREELTETFRQKLSTKGFIGSAATRYAEAIVGIFPNDVIADKSLLDADLRDIMKVMDEVVNNR